MFILHRMQVNVLPLYNENTEKRNMKYRRLKLFYVISTLLPHRLSTSFKGSYK